MLENEATISTSWAVASVSIPVGVYLLSIFVLWFYMVRQWDALHTLMLGGAAVFLVAATWMASAGVVMGWCLLVVMLAPVAIVVGYETRGHRHLAENFERLAV